MYQIKLFDNILNLKDTYCSKNNCEGIKIEQPYVNMYVRLRNNCNAKCKFCEFTNNKEYFDIIKFEYILNKIKNKVKINKLSFTGGEPTLDVNFLKNCLKIVKNLDENIFTVVNTNGVNLKSLDNTELINSISLSRHHYEDKKNNEILGYEAPSASEIKNFNNKKYLHLSCNLINGYIDSSKEVLNYLEKSSELGVLDVGFVSLMKINNYCKENHIDFSLLDFSNEKNIYINKNWEYKDSCKCRNYLYISNSTDDIVRAYSRYYVKNNNVESQLVFDGKYLKDGFNGKIII